jgi:hypothetical protein
MPTTVRLDPKTEALLDRLVRKSGRTKSQIIREAIKTLANSERGGPGVERPYEAWAHVIGIASGGPPDLSERTGEKFTKLLMARARR